MAQICMATSLPTSTDLGHVSDALHGQVHQHADLAAHVDIGHIDALGIADEAADLDVLPDGEHLVGGDGGDGAVGAGIAAGLQSLHIGGVLGGDDGGHVLDKALEHLVLGHEVGLGVDLHRDAHASLIDDGVGDALGGHLAGLLGLGGEGPSHAATDSLVHCRRQRSQRLLAVHHAHAGHLAQGLYVLRGKAIINYLHFIFSRAHRPGWNMSNKNSAPSAGGRMGSFCLLSGQRRSLGLSSGSLILAPACPPGWRWP